jgi:predicted short-subunit dehydrogenase-like oxidoreductase (DUF2520 family)
MYKIAIIGSGNVATHLLTGFANVADVVQIPSRDISNNFEIADIYVIAVSDNAIASVAYNLRRMFDCKVSDSSIVVHTSGSTSIDILSDFKNYGVFYPLQTFTKNVILNYSEIPVFIEGNNDYSLSQIINIAKLFSTKVKVLSSEKRMKMHLASVFACNYVNHLIFIASELMKEEGLDMEYIKPLLNETFRKIENTAPYDAQTGPARRGDTVVMDKHLALLKEHNKLQNLYRMLSENIINTYKE